MIFEFAGQKIRAFEKEPFTAAIDWKPSRWEFRPIGEIPSWWDVYLDWFVSKKELEDIFSGDIESAFASLANARMGATA